MIRVPIVACCLSLVAGPVLSPLPLSAQQTNAAAAVDCDYSMKVFRSEKTIIVDRRATPLARAAKVTYRLDDRNGYWIYPETAADQAVLTVPDEAVEPENLSIARIEKPGDSTHVCKPTILAPRALGSPSPVDGPGVDRLAIVTHVADPLSCAVPFADPHVAKAIPPETPLIAMQQGIVGVVRIHVDVDAEGNVASARILTSPSSLLNNVSLQSARQWTFAPAVFRCAPIPSTYTFEVEFATRRF